MLPNRSTMLVLRGPGKPPGVASDRSQGLSAVPLPVLLPQEIRAELGEARATDLPHHEVDLVDEDLDRLLDAGQPAGRRAIEGRTPHETEIGPEAEGYQDV